MANWLQAPQLGFTGHPGAFRGHFFHSGPLPHGGSRWGPPPQHHALQTAGRGTPWSEREGIKRGPAPWLALKQYNLQKKLPAPSACLAFRDLVPLLTGKACLGGIWGLRSHFGSAPGSSLPPGLSRRAAGAPLDSASALLLLPQLKGREESLTYAELELQKPLQEAKGTSSATVYAQILFEENKV